MGEAFFTSNIFVIRSTNSIKFPTEQPLDIMNKSAKYLKVVLQASNINLNRTCEKIKHRSKFHSIEPACRLSVSTRWYSFAYK